MTKVSNKAFIQKKVPLTGDTVFGGDNDDEGKMVRYDIEALAALINSLQVVDPDNSTKKTNSYFPSGW